MDVKGFVEKFDFNNPIWKNLPEKFPNCDLKDLTSAQIGRFAAIKSLWEIAHPPKSIATSRAWQDPLGFRFLAPWSNAVLLRILVRKFTVTLPSLNRPLKSPNNPLEDSKGPYRSSEHRLKAQLDDAARSVTANIEEGFKRPTTKEYLEFLGFSQGSLEEVKGDVNRSLQDGFLKSLPGSALSDLGLDLKEWGLWCQKPANHSRLLSFSLRESKGLYRSLEELKGEELTYEIFMELINKTDYLLRKLVESLEIKGGNKDKLEDGRWVKF